MRGLKNSAGRDTNSGRRRFGGGTLAAGTTAMAGLAAIGLFVAGCDTGGTGPRDEGAARSLPAVGTNVPSPDSGTSPVTEPGGRVNAPQLLKRDPKVSATVKRDLKPCSGHDYPVDVSYGHLTGNDAPDVVVNVMTCQDAVGVATYVYREQNNTYKNVFTAEAAPVYSEIDRGDLVVTKQQYEKGDSVSYASSEDVITYHWSNNKFTESDSVHTDFSKAVGDSDGASDVAPTAAPPSN
ncbi:hypothetical protein AB0436_26875 [Streptomyces sp. NPDC051322]|uniref:hypothetical protein n=1 Tax=Streptomyces sp. NPDC051322 TaxID=3154645 RepID=UPI00344BB7EF